MKEAFWGILVIALGLFGIVVVNLFQKVTVDNDRVYYVLKESAEASMYDSLDLSFYRTHGTFRIVEEKFVESLTKRFSNSVTVGNYKIIVADINELPAFASVYVLSGISSLNNESFTLTNGVSGIIETKYSEDEVINFLGITKEEWEALTKDKEDYCDNDIINSDIECITGDVMFTGWSNLKFSSSDQKETTGYICRNETPSSATMDASYKVCKCNKWDEDITKKVTAEPVKNNNEYDYTFTIDETIGTYHLKETTVEKVKISDCVTGFSLSAKREYGIKTIYGDCNSGVWVKNSDTIKVIPSYTPDKAVNRYLEWSKNDTNNYLLSVTGQAKSVVNKCVYSYLETGKRDCLSYATVKTNTTASSNATASVTATTKRSTIISETCNLKFDTDKPTCSVSVGTSGVTITYSDSTSGVVRIGYGSSEANAKANVETISESNTGSVTKTIGFTGYQYGYVIDAAGNENSCVSAKQAVDKTRYSVYCGDGCCGTACTVSIVSGTGMSGFNGLMCFVKTCWCSCSYPIYCDKYHCTETQITVNDTYCYER